MATATINGIPVFSATLEAEECGIYRISLVDFPAVESNFVAYGKQGEMLKYSVLSEEKRLVRGVVMRADFPIYRRDEQFGEYYIVHSPEMIRKTAQKFLKEHRTNEVNVMHEALTEVKGVEMVQMFIKDAEAGVNPIGFEDVENGSLFAEYHVSNDDVWSAIKAGTFKGFSLEGIFTFQPKEVAQEVTQSAVEHFIKNTTMSIKQKLAKILAQFRSLTTDNGIIAWEGEDDLKVGDAVFVESEDGERTPAPDGDYTLEDGVVIRVEGGKVAEIVEVEPETEVEPAEEVVEEEQPAEEAPADETPAEDDRVAKLEERVAKLEEQINSLLEANTAMKEQLSAIEKRPLAKPASEQFRSAQKIEPTGNRRTDKLMEKLPNLK